MNIGKGFNPPSNFWGYSVGVKLKLTFLQNIDVVCMPKPDDFKHHLSDDSVKCYVTGWGRRSETSEHSLVLKEIQVPLWSHDTCSGALQAQFGPAYVLPDTTICAGAEGRDACDVSN